MRRLLPVALAMILAGCGGYYAHYEKSADREVAPILLDLEQRVAAETPEAAPPGVISPQPQGPEVKPAVVDQTGVPRRIINLEEALALAFTSSRDFQFQKESLYLSALAFTLVRHQYDWIPAAVVSGAVTADGGGGDGSVSADADAALALSKRLLSGGRFDVAANVFHRGSVSGPVDDTNGSNAALSFRQPLLAGSGVSAREPLVQATRSLLYDARGFELFRQDFAIEIIATYYDLLRRRRFIQTDEANLEQNRFLLERSKALFDKGKLKLVDVFRAEEQTLTAENRLNDDRSAYNFALDRFKITLGFPTSADIDVADEKIEPVIVSVDVEAAVETALTARLDLLSEQEQLADAERRVLVARNELLPVLEAFANADSVSAVEDIFGYRADDSSASAGLRLVLPLDMKAERNAYKGSLIALDRQRRSYTLAEDQVVLNVRQTVRDLRQAEFSLVIQQKQVANAKDRLDAAYLLVEKGEASNRDIVEAQTALQEAQNSLVDAQVNYLIGYIQLLKDMGTLHVDEQGHWR